MTETSEEFAQRMEHQFGLGWKSDIGLVNTYNRLKQYEEQESIITETTKEIEESFQKGEKAIIRQELLKGLQNLALSIVHDRQEQREINEKHYAMLEELEEGVKAWKKALRDSDKLLAILKTSIEDAEKAKDLFMEQIGHLRKIEIEYVEVIRSLRETEAQYNQKVLELNEWFKQKQAEYNKEIRRLNRMRG